MSDTIKNHSNDNFSFELNGLVFFNILVEMKRPLDKSDMNSETQLFNDLVNLVLCTTNREDIRVSMHKNHVNEYKRADRVMRFNKTKRAVYTQLFDHRMHDMLDFSDDFKLFSDRIVKYHILGSDNKSVLTKESNPERYEKICECINTLLFYIANDTSIDDDSIFYMFGSENFESFKKSVLINENERNAFLNNDTASDISIDVFLYRILCYVVFNKSVLSNDKYHPTQEKLKEDISLLNRVFSQKLYSDFHMSDKKLTCMYSDNFAPVISPYYRKPILETLSLDNTQCDIIQYTNLLYKYCYDQHRLITESKIDKLFESFDAYKPDFENTINRLVDFCNTFNLYSIIYNGLSAEAYYTNVSKALFNDITTNYTRLLEQHKEILMHLISFCESANKGCGSDWFYPLYTLYTLLIKYKVPNKRFSEYSDAFSNTLKTFLDKENELKFFGKEDIQQFDAIKNTYFKLFSVKAK